MKLDMVAGLARRIRDSIRDKLTRIATSNTRSIAGKLTLLLFVLYGGDYWDLNIPIVIFAAIGLVASSLQTNGWYWAVIVAVLAKGSLPRFFVLDNHKILMIYWALALALSATPAYLATNARRLIGLAFLFAVAWKIASPDFAEGSFFHLTLVVDGRFSGFTRIVGNVSADALASNQLSMRDLLSGDITSFKTVDSPGLSMIAVGMSWWTLFIEGAVAVAFLGAGWSHRLHCLRNPLLILFLLSTYAIATVIGFGWLLAICGYAQTENQEKRSRIAFLVALLVLQLYRAPWTQLTFSPTT